MKNKLNSLILLQDCDNKIKEVFAQKEEGPIKIKELEMEFNAQEQKFNEIHDKLELLKKDRRGIEQDILEIDNKNAKSQAKLNNIKSNKEYRSALKEVDDLNREKSLAEDRLIQLMEETEELEEVAVKNKEIQAELRKKFDSDTELIRAGLGDLNKKSDLLAEQRKTLYEVVDKDLLKTYLFLKDRKEGQAISPVIEGVCQTCHMGIPPQQFNELKKCLTLLTCPNCNRMIFWGEDETFQKSMNMLEQDK